jgi:cell volume regulation protein A
VKAGDPSLILLVGAAVVIAAIVAARVAHGIGLPGLLLFLGLGLALGEAGVGVRFDNAELAQALGLSALVLILAEGGLTTNWLHARAAAPAALLLATRVTVSIAVVALVSHWLLFWVARLLAARRGAGPTDAAAVFSVLRKLPLRPGWPGCSGRVGAQRPARGAAVTLLSGTGPHVSGPALIAGIVVYELAAGAAIGLLAGLLGWFTLRRVALPASGLYPIAVLALIVASYGAASLAHASGFLAVYLAALVLGNVRLPHGAATRGFAEGVAWLAQIGLFVMLGLLASPVRLPGAVLPALLAGSALVLVARPLAVVASVLPLRVPWRQQAFLSWAGLRGAVPIVLATIPISAHLPGATKLFDLVFVVDVVFTLLQGPTLPWVARRLKVITPAEPMEIDVEAAPLEAIPADLLQAEIPPGSRLHGVEIAELRLPAEANVALIVRDSRGFVPDPATTLQAGDRLLVVAAAGVRERTERRLRAVSRGGRLACIGSGARPVTPTLSPGGGAARTAARLYCGDARPGVRPGRSPRPGARTMTSFTGYRHMANESDDDAALTPG